MDRVAPTSNEAAAVIAAYRDIRAGRGESVQPPDLWVAIASDVIFRLPSVGLAESHDAVAHSGVGTYVYLFTWETAALGGMLGSCHGLEMPFVFGTVQNPSVQLFSGGGDDAFELSEGMRRSWAAFARAGTPSNDTAGEWPAWGSHQRATMVFGPWPGNEGMWRSISGPRDAELEALAPAIVRR